MLTMSDRETVREAVNDIMSEEEMFTLFDVTLCLQQMYGWTYKHKEIKKEIEEIVKDLSETIHYAYTSTFVEVTPNVHARVFHGITQDPEQYVSKWIKDTKKKDEPEDEVVKVDKRGRICIPAKYIKQFNTDTVGVFSNVYNTALIVDANPKVNDVVIYKVDCYNNIRIPKKLLKKIGIKKQYSVQQQHNTIVIF